MIDPKAEALFRREQPAPAALSEYQKQELAIRTNFERLKQQRRDREASAPT
jgi:hypothetical protein